MSSTFCTICRHLKVTEIQFKSDGSKPVRAGECKSYNCTLQGINGTFAPNILCIKDNGSEVIS